MRLRLGLLNDQAAIDAQIAREAREAEAARRRASSSGKVHTVPTEAEAKREKQLSDAERHQIEEKVKKEDKEKQKRRQARIRPLSEAKAIETGANFVSETFTFGIGLAILLAEYWRSSRKESNRRDEVKERIGKLEGMALESEQEIRRLENTIVWLRAEQSAEHAAAQVPESQTGTSKNAEGEPAGA